MVRLSNLADYAVVVMCQMALTDDARPSAASVAAATNVPLPTVAKLLGTLSRAGLLQSYRGIGGGFALARPAGEISVAEIVEAVDGPIALTHCTDPAPGQCAREGICSIKPHWQIINRTIRDALSTVSLADLVQGTVSLPALEAAEPPAAPNQLRR
ncbi:SUF system Fe-S cluster assembly regulator [Pedomonas sp. V897]|uniref:SUF system Fe-S cluster assembly regulator n=1 Tax=Pedomonas sp. V897 TaxID=3446482 RepID=UPI003EE0C353